MYNYVLYHLGNMLHTLYSIPLLLNLSKSKYKAMSFEKQQKYDLSPNQVVFTPLEKPEKNIQTQEPIWMNRIFFECVFF